MPVTASTPPRASRIVRIAAMLVLVLSGAFCILLLAIRFVVFPQVESHRADIARWLGTRIGQPVEIDDVQTGWDGWNPRLSIRGFRVREAAAVGATLDLPHVDLVIAWTSLPLLDVRLKELLIESPRLAVRRDTQGRLHVAGIEIDPDVSSDNPAFADWLMRQPRVVVRDALVIWNDEFRHAPQLILDHVQFRLEQRFGRHRIGLTGVPPSELAAPIDLRAEVTGGSLKDWKDLRGRVYLRLDYADIAAWGEWLPLPVPVDSGKGAMRLWVDFAASQPVDVVADLALYQVRATLGDNLPPLALTHLAGRAGWKHSAGHTEIYTEGLSFELPDGVSVPPTDFRLVQDVAADHVPAHGRIAFDRLDLAPLVAIAAHLPIPDTLRQELARFDPRGTLRNGAIDWTGPADAPQRYAIKGDFSALTIAAQDALPGATNLTGSVEASEKKGQLKLATRAGALALPRVFAEPLALDSLTGAVTWDLSGTKLQVDVRDLAFASPYAAGSASAQWHSAGTGPGDIDLKAQLTHADLGQIQRYLPRGFDAPMRDWLRRAIVKGTSNDAKLLLAGDLSQFPFPQGKGGQFVVAAKTQGGTLDYADDWPPITDIDADLRIEGTHVAVAAARGRVFGAQIGATRADVADFRDPHAQLRIDGTAAGPTADFLAFIARSPIAGWISHATDSAQATGDGQLALRFSLPLHEREGVSVAGNYQFNANTIRQGGAPTLSGVNGKLEFTERGIHATDISAVALGGPLKLQVAGESGHVQVNGSGVANLQALRAQYDAPLLNRVGGNADWVIALSAGAGQVEWTVDSSLQGATIDLPAPFSKSAGVAVPLHIERRNPQAHEDRIVVDYGSAAKIVLHRQLNADGASIDRVLVSLGKATAQAAEPDAPGIWVRADLASIDIDDWLAVDLHGGAGTTTGGAPLELNGVDLNAASLRLLGRKLTAIKATARRQGSDWRLALNGTDVEGTAVWQGETAGLPNGRLVARLTRLTKPIADDTANSGAGAPTAGGGANRWPEVDLSADAFWSKGRLLGRLELLAQPSGTDWQIRKLSLANESGRIEASGWWRNTSVSPQTQLDVAIDVKEAGAFLGRFGWPDALKGAATRIDGQVAWTGAPSDFDYKTLSGHFSLHSGQGQFTKIEPGVGRLLGVLSLQALPRRISLDFRDVFSEGFAFDSIAGDVRMQSGVMHTDNLRFAGPGAGVDIAGDVDLAQETQQLKVRVRPSISSGVSAGAAALFLANPLVGAAVGAGTLLAQKMFNNPFDQLFSYEYGVSGSWDDPVVTRGAARAAAGQPSTTTTTR